MKIEQKTQIGRSYDKLVRPWTSLGLEPPAVSVKEVSRTTGIDAGALIRSLADQRDPIVVNGRINGRLVLQDLEDRTIEEIVEEAAPFKRAVRKSEYRSKAPGGGPVIKRRINKKSLKKKLSQLGREKLRIGISPYDEMAEKQQKREKIQQKLASRWLAKSSTESEPVLSQAEKVLLLISELSEKKGVVNEQELVRRVKENIELGNPQTILVIWGPPYEGQGFQNIFEKVTPELKMAEEIFTVIERLNKTIETRLLVLYADYYGKDINGISDAAVQNYGEQISERVGDEGDFISWSKLKEDNISRYRELSRELKLGMIIPDKNEINRATIMQAKLGKKVNIKEAAKSASKYKKERIIEGQILQESFLYGDKKYQNLIKLGTAPSKANDDPYEAGLPRFYVSGMSRAAWNSPR